jgi:hypothetical protein
MHYPRPLQNKSSELHNIDFRKAGHVAAPMLARMASALQVNAASVTSTETFRWRIILASVAQTEVIA